MMYCQCRNRICNYTEAANQSKVVIADWTLRRPASASLRMVMMGRRIITHGITAANSSLPYIVGLRRSAA